MMKQGGRAGGLQNILFKVDALDPFNYTTVAALLTAVAAAAACRTVQLVMSPIGS